jgi:hypothetical protein
VIVQAKDVEPRWFVWFGGVEMTISEKHEATVTGRTTLWFQDHGMKVTVESGFEFSAYPPEED